MGNSPTKTVTSASESLDIPVQQTDKVMSGVASLDLIVLQDKRPPYNSVGEYDVENDGPPPSFVYGKAVCFKIPE